MIKFKKMTEEESKAHEKKMANAEKERKQKIQFEILERLEVEEEKAEKFVEIKEKILQYLKGKGDEKMFGVQNLSIV